jgi:glycosyltransferase involved in cell wall biosynthesis
MKVCHIITDLDVGGAELMLKRLVEFKPADKQNVVIISLMEPGKVGHSLTLQGFSVLTTSMNSKASFLLTLYKLYKLLKQLKPDVVQTWMYHSDLLGGLAAKFAGCNAISWGIHGTFLPIGRPLTKLVMKICAVLSFYIPQKIVCVAELGRVKHVEYGYDHSKMVVIPNGFDVDFFTNLTDKRTSLRESLGFCDSDIVLGCVGRFHPDKGQDLLLAAVAGLIHKYPDLKLVLAGRNCDWNNALLLQNVDSFNLKANVVLLGERDDIPQLLQTFDIYCMPSRTEAFPVALGEAMCSGLACVATQVGDTGLLLGECGLLAEANSHDLNLKLLEMLAFTAAKREELGNNARDRIKALFSLEQVHLRYHQLHESLIE